VKQDSLLVNEHEQQASFLSYIKKYNKVYSTPEILTRYYQFRKNLDYIQQHNSKQTSYKLGVNQFADLSLEEFKELQINGFKPIKHDYIRSLNVEKNLAMIELTGSLDWREKGAVTSIKNQGNCGACWSFSAVGAIEGATAISTGVLYDLSEQQLMDCSSEYGNMGCNGGLMDNAFEYLLSKQGKTGLCTEKEYPYKQKVGSCKSKQCVGVANITGYKDVESNSEESLLSAASLGPVSVSIQAQTLSFMLYESGIYDDPECTDNLDHGVLLVGYGTGPNSTNLYNKNEETLDFYIVKNSWGTEWGEKGFIRMIRGKNMCGIAKMASYVTVN